MIEEFMQISFSNGRCFFNGFNPINEIPFGKGKTGVNYCRYQFIGALLKKMGLTFELNYQMDGKTYACHIYKHSFNRWVERHQNQVGAPAALQGQKAPEMLIKTISENLSKKTIPQGPKPTQACLSHAEATTKAHETFEKHAIKDEILKEINATLDRYHYQRYLDKGESPRFQVDAWALHYSEWDLISQQRDSRRILSEAEIKAINFVIDLVGMEISPSPALYNTMMQLAEIKFQDQSTADKHEILKHVQEKIMKKQVMAFLSTLPGVDNSEYTGDYLK
jgi:hypothetical protein